MGFELPKKGKGFTYIGEENKPVSPEIGDTFWDVDNEKTCIYTSTGWQCGNTTPILIGGEYGYVCGGSTSGDIGGQISLINRISYEFETVSQSTNSLSTNTTSVVGCNSSLYGYLCGGYTTSWTTKIDKLSFANNSTITTSVGNISTTRLYHSGCNSSQYAYIIGSGQNYGNYLSSIERVLFPIEGATGVVCGNLIINNGTWRQATFNSSRHGYVCGGTYYYNEPKKIDRFAFPFDSGTTVTVGEVVVIRSSSIGVNSSLFGYVCGGACDGYGTACSYVERIDMSLTTGNSVVVGYLSNSKQVSSSNNSSKHGYICGGYTTLSVIDRFLFPFDSGISTIFGNLSIGSHGGAGLDNTDFTVQFV